VAVDNINQRINQRLFIYQGRSFYAFQKFLHT